MRLVASPATQYVVIDQPGDAPGRTAAASCHARSPNTNTQLGWIAIGMP
jgi:hypothetical protein